MFDIIRVSLDRIWSQLHVREMAAAYSDVRVGLKVSGIDTCQPPMVPSLREHLRAVARVVDRFRQSEKPDLGGFFFGFELLQSVQVERAPPTTAQSSVL